MKVLSFVKEAKKRGVKIKAPAMPAKSKPPEPVVDDDFRSIGKNPELKEKIESLFRDWSGKNITAAGHPKALTQTECFVDQYDMGND